MTKLSHEEIVSGESTSEHKEKRNFSITKEVPISWLVTMLIGGIANFAAIIWIAATLVRDVDSLKTVTKEHDVQIKATEKTESFHATSMEKLFLMIQSLENRMIRNEAIQDRQDERITNLREKRK